MRAKKRFMIPFQHRNGAAKAYIFLTTFAACFIVTWPHYRETTLGGSLYIWNHGSTGWAESTHSEPMWRYTYAVEIATYIIIGCQYLTSYTSSVAVLLANFVLIFVMYLRATEAQSVSLNAHNTVHSQTVVTLCVLLLNCASLLGTAARAHVKSDQHLE